MIARGALAGSTINHLKVAQGLFAEELQSDNNKLRVLASGMMKRRRIMAASNTIRFYESVRTSTFASLFARDSIKTKSKSVAVRRKSWSATSRLATGGKIFVNKRKTMRLGSKISFHEKLALFHRYLRAAPHGQGMIVPRDNRHMTLRGGNRKT